VPACRSYTFQKLVETGDRVRIEGCVSGTLMFIASAVSAGRKFSDAVRKPSSAARRARSARRSVGP
jgi:homoserine dehydrogenase